MYVQTAYKLLERFGKVLFLVPLASRETREIFETYFRKGYRVVDFPLDRPHHRGRYLLAKKDA